MSGLLSRILAATEPTVFLGSAAVVVLFVASGTLDTETAATFFQSIQTFLVDNLGWFYILTATCLVFWGVAQPVGSEAVLAQLPFPEVTRSSSVR